jgi:starch synthase
MKVLYITSEALPFASSGGLGDVMGALPQAVKEAGADIETSVIMPLYQSIGDEWRKSFEKISDLSFNLAWRNTGASVYKSEFGGVSYYFIENSYYFDRNSLYGEYDDGERFAFFGTAVIEFLLKNDFYPDVIHANDWQCALPIIYLKTKYRNNSHLNKIKTVYTIHNIEYQGKYDLAILGDVFALDNVYSGAVEYDGCINLMKGALISADYVTTVSPNYANELGYDYFAHGLARIIESIRYKFRGIINGIDYKRFSPKTDNSILYNYSAKAFKLAKAKNKKALQEELGLKVDEKIPLLAMVTRLAQAKGIELVLHIIEELLCENIQLVILGTGETEYENKLIEIQERYENFKAVLRFDRDLSKRIYAGADIFIMPSKSEPCGLSQIISLSYGAIPVVRRVGGLYDTIIPYGKEGSIGFTFDNYNAHELLFAVISAIRLYFEDKSEWNNLVKRAMSVRYDWLHSANEYADIYKKIIGKEN